MQPGTETNLIYDVDINFTNKPQNLKIYLDENMTQEVNIVNNSIQFSKFLTFNDAQTVQRQPFYWNWPLETGETEEEIELNNIEDTKSINKIMSAQIAVTGRQINGNGGNIIYNGNGATSGGMFSDVINAGSSISLTANNYQRKYTVNLDANGGSVDDDKLVCEYEFSHWSTDGRKNNVLYHSNIERKRESWMAGTGPEFIQYTDLAPYIGKYGTGKYFIAFDIKSEDISKRDIIQLYTQNGTGARYSIGYTYINVSTIYQHYKSNVNVANQKITDSVAWLAFYGGYGTGNNPNVKNVTFDVGNGYENEQEINYSQISNSQSILYAKWIPKPVTLPTPTKQGSTFIGWYTQKEGGERVDNIYTPTENITLYAHWN